jgi:fructose-1,6-bisphosphatase/inositol monophosphatase family enzyme
MENTIMPVLIQYVKTAGEIARKRQQDLAVELKPDDSYVTQVDMELSTLAMDTLSTVIPREHIITEEHLENLYALTDKNGLHDAEILAIVDPIDGTRNYFHNMPLYGISVGVLRNREPWLGAVIFPALDELFISNGRSVQMIHGVYSSSPVEKKLEPDPVPVNRNSVMLFSNSYTRSYRWSYDVCTWIVSACVTVNACWPLVRRGVGTVFTDHIWDFAGGWPMLKALGFELREVATRREITHYDPSDYDPEKHTVREPILVCRPEHFETLRQGVIPLNGTGGLDV